jgi:peptide deformylase
MVEIVQSKHPILREIAKEVPISHILNPEIKKILQDMSLALDSQDDGVAIAAPQIAVSMRIFMVSGKVFDEDFINGKNLQRSKKIPNMIFINPKIKKISKDKKLLPEGCLSVRPVYGKVRRATRVTVEAYNEKAHKFTKEGTGLLAHIFQHEIDHLDGILFIDKAKDMKEIDPNNI